MVRVVILAALLVGACSDDGAVDDDAKAPPPIEVISETPGDWTDLSTLIGQTPAASGLLSKSPIVTDLDALMGPDAIDFRRRIVAKGGKLTEAGAVLYVATPAGPEAAYLVLDPAQHALEAGRRVDGEWKVRQTAASEIAIPDPVRLLRAY